MGQFLFSTNCKASKVRGAVFKAKSLRGRLIKAEGQFLQSGENELAKGERQFYCQAKVGWYSLKIVIYAGNTYNFFEGQFCLDRFSDPDVVQ